MVRGSRFLNFELRTQNFELRTQNFELFTSSLEFSKRPFEELLGEGHMLFEVRL